MNHKRTVQLLLIDGDANGRVQAKLDNWTGVAYKIPRILLGSSKDRDDLKFCGVYFLFGHDDDLDEDIVYIGQARERKTGESLIARSREHNKSESKQFCNEIVFFTTSTNDFGPTELCYLENKFWNLADKAGRFKLSNNCEPSIGNVTEAKQAELDRYIEHAKILMTTFGYRVFDPLENISPAPEPVEPEVSRRIEFTLRVPRFKTEAHAVWTNQGIVLLKGSDVINRLNKGAADSLKERREKMIASKELSTSKTVDGIEILTLNKDQLFKSPSGAGAFVYGGPIQGTTAWKTDDGLTFAAVAEKLEN